jgi:predicted RNA-binding protein Jag
VPLHILRNNTITQMVNFLQGIFETEARRSEDETVLQATEAAIREVVEQARPVELAPQNNYVRRLQHRLAERYGLVSHSMGNEPYRRVVIYPK